MANLYKMYSLCRVCFGTGIELSGQPDGHGGTVQTEQPCVACGELGKTAGAEIDLTDLEDKINDILDKVNDIKEKLDEM